MRKIRGFRLNLRVKDIQRRARKARVDLGALGLGAEPALEAWLRQVSATARPAVLYDSFPADAGRAPARRGASEEAAGASAVSLSPMPGLAYSLALATLGPDLDAFADRLAQERPAAAPLFALAAAAAIEESVRFVLALVETEATEERCSLSPIQYFEGREQFEAVLAKLEGHKIGVALAESGLRPSRSTAFSTSWLARSKSRAKSSA
ncbi:MAG: hypothetical protein HY554_10470 [Elusimicrobia bacterium]|nr:hypothetical protein [Elusimicrobiota bacterium]